MIRPLRVLLPLLLVGCVVFDKKSESVTFHQFASANILAAKPAPVVHVPRVLLPTSLRRSSIVMPDESGAVRVDEAHRWAGPLDRLIAENLGNRITASSGLPTSAHAPSQPHVVLLVTIERFSVAQGDQATLSMRYTIERSDGELLGHGSGSWTSALKDRSPAAFVKAQSNNLANAAAVLSTELVKSASETKTSTK